MGRSADVRVDQDLHDRAKAQCATERRSLKSLVDGLLADYLAEHADPDDYKRARGIVPATPGTLSPEAAVRKIRGGENV